MSRHSNRIKAEILGMPFGTASGRLRKLLLFDFAQKLNKDICFKCGNRIDNVEDFSIEHITTWQNSDSPIKTFFDIENIAFSHLKCNSVNRGTFQDGFDKRRRR